jgi:hypothetical protein
VSEIREKLARAIQRRYGTEEAGLVAFNAGLPEAREDADAAIAVFAEWLRAQPDALGVIENAVRKPEGK